MKHENMPFSDVLAALFADEDVSVALLYRLSDLPEEDWTRFWQAWSTAVPERRHVIARHMADIAEEDFVVDFSPYFKQFLQDDEADVRVAALDGLWDATDVNLVGPILNMLQQDESVAVQTAAAATLAHFVLMSEWGEISPHISPRVVGELVKVYEREGTAVSIKRAALEAMAPANNLRVVEHIRAAYNDRLDEMRQSAIFAMGSNADTRWMPIILQEMNSLEAEMRAEAARAAGLIGSSDAVEQLATLAHEDDEDIALVAVASLGQIGSEEAQEILMSMLEDEEFASLHETIEEALEEMTWMNQALELLHVDADDDELE
ncbi:MAG: HEAT repeat domain-containing protein [Ardenticatenaceae bacterium]|nr:HEAT repeat domain-containing protein [Ardenticatenaceae bacterium]